MKVLWILAALLHATAASVAALGPARARAGALAALLGATALAFGWIGFASPADGAAWVPAVLALASGVAALLACAAQRRLATEAARAQAKADALEEEQRRYVEESSTHLEASRARFRALADAAPLGVIETDAGGRCTYVSARWSRMTGIAREDARDDGWLAAVHADERERVAASWRRAVGEGAAFQEEFRGSLAGEGARHFLCQLGRRPAQAGEPDGYIGTFSDVTERRAAEVERRRLEARVQHAQKLESLGVLAGGMAHDFNNLLVGILGNLHAAKAKGELTGEAALLLARAETAALRASDLARDMLGYAGRGGAQPEPLYLSAIAGEMAPLLEVSLPEGASIACELDPDLPALEGDPTQLRQLVLNLLTNALEACAGRPARVALRTGRARNEELPPEATHTGEPFPAGEHLYLEVSDTGRGIDPATAARMFEPFFTTKPEGRGLGLAVVLGVVRNLHGALQVDSDPTRGTTIRALFRPSSRPAVSVEPKRRATED